MKYAGDFVEFEVSRCLSLGRPVFASASVYVLHVCVSDHACLMCQVIENYTTLATLRSAHLCLEEFVKY